MVLTLNLKDFLIGAFIHDCGDLLLLLLEEIIFVTFFDILFVLLFSPS